MCNWCPKKADAQDHGGDIMIDYEDALAQMIPSMPASGTENVSLHESEGRVLASDVCARWHHPFADVSAMDGYALAHQPARFVHGDAGG